MTTAEGNFPLQTETPWSQGGAMSAATVPYYQWVACPDAACPNSSRGPWLVLEALGTYTAFCYACALCGASMRLTAADR